MRQRQADFLVVGGGPAGSAFATRARQAGAEVLLAERSVYEERRPGEHLTGRVRTQLDALGVRAERGPQARTSPGIDLWWTGSPAPQHKRYREQGHQAAIAVDRRRFDAMLFSAASHVGVQTLEGSRVLDVRRSSRGWIATLSSRDGALVTIEASALVDASGRRAIVAQRHGAIRRRQGDLIAIVRWLQTEESSAQTAAPLVLESCRSGWWSSSSADEGTQIVTLFTSAARVRGQGDPTTFWERELATTRHIRETLHGAVPHGPARTFPAFPSVLDRCAAPGWIAIGESALAFDPVSGQGVVSAIDLAFRASEAAMVDPQWTALGATFTEAVHDQYEKHLVRRAEAYAGAADVIDPDVQAAILGTPLSHR